MKILETNGRYATASSQPGNDKLLPQSVSNIGLGLDMPCRRDEATMEALLRDIKQSTGFDIGSYKRAGLERRIRLRMSRIGITDSRAYQTYLKKHPEEMSPLLDLILINVTSFFRDTSAWSFLKKRVIPQIIKAADNGQIRIWSTGCSSGQEVYSLAMVMAEALGLDAFLQQVTILGSDIDDVALKQARMGTYSAKELLGVAACLRNNFFQKENERFVFTRMLRPSIHFCHHDLIHDFPFCHLDLLVCRNTLIYFNSEAQKRAFARFHVSLKNNGYLFLGSGETVHGHENLFKTVSAKHHIFAKVPKMSAGERLQIYAQAGTLFRDKIAPHAPTFVRTGSLPSQT